MWRGGGVWRSVKCVEGRSVEGCEMCGGEEQCGGV